MAPRPEGRTPQRVVRVGDDLWERFGTACEAIGTSRSDQLRVYMSAFVEEHERKLERKARAAAAKQG